MRPVGEIASAVRRAFDALGQGTWRDVYTWCTRMGLQTTEAAIRRTVENMARNRTLVLKGHAKCPGSRRPLCVYALACARPMVAANLDALFTSWKGQPQAA